MSDFYPRIYFEMPSRRLRDALGMQKEVKCSIFQKKIIEAD